jgi:2-polyprenyl-6-methoxyphenol hydroxylase-like FAD-dependent oxidoreductase
MLDAEVAVVGAGIAGSVTAAMLGKAGLSVLLFDARKAYPPDFRCEKIDERQLALLAQTGLADRIVPSATPIDKLWIGKFGRLVEKRASRQFGICYADLVNAARAAADTNVRFRCAKVASIETGPEKQTIVTADGETFSVRLAVVATGLNDRLRQALQIRRTDLSKCHSVSIGFDIAPKANKSFDFPALTWFGERPSGRVSYLTLFPIKSAMRANLFVYRPPRDPWLQAFRGAPQATLHAAMPRLAGFLDAFDVAGDIRIRPADLYASTGYLQPGVVLIGDAFATSCPAAGTGLTKVLTDATRLCQIHVPRWLASAAIGSDKIAAFYEDPVKRACDTHSMRLAHFMRMLAVDRGLVWRGQRLGRSLLQGARGAWRSRMPIGPSEPRSKMVRVSGPGSCGSPPER